MDQDWLPRISASCPDCGEVQLSPHDLTLVLPMWDTDREWSYRFECPVCTLMIARPMNRSDLELLVSLGIRMDFELEGPQPEFGGPAPELPGSTDPQGRSS